MVTDRLGVLIDALVGTVGVPVPKMGTCATVTFMGTNGLEVLVPDDVGETVPTGLEEIAQAVSRSGMHKTEKREWLILILPLVFKPHFPDGFQQRAALFETGFTKVAHPQVDLAATAAQEANDQV